MRKFHKVVRLSGTQHYSPARKKPISSVSGVCTVSGTLEARQEEEGFIELVRCCKVQDGTVQPDKYRDLSKTRQTSRKGVDFVGLVQFCDLLVHHVGITLVLGLELLDGWLQSLRVFKDSVIYVTNDETT